MSPAAPEPPAPRARVVADSLVAVVLCVGAALPGARYLVERVPDESVRAEKRPPAPAPTGDLDPLEELPDAFAAWFGDTHPWRRLLVRTHNRMVLLGLGDAPAAELLVGKDGWLFYRGDFALDSYRVTSPYTEAELGAVEACLRSRADWCAARDVAYRFVIGPNKHTIYPEMLPDWVRPLEARSRADQLFERLAGSGIAVDPRAAVRAVKARELAYYPHGTHWTFPGSFAAYEELCASLGIEPLPREAYRETLVPLGDSWATSLHLEDRVVQETVKLDPKAPAFTILEVRQAPNGQLDGTLGGPDPDAPRIVLFRDSFGNWLWPYLAPHASRLRSESAVRWSTDMILAERADVVVDQLVERHLSKPTLRELAADPEDLRRSRRWLSGRAPADPVSLGVPPAARAAMVRLETDAAAPGRARVAGRVVQVPAGRAFTFVELDDVSPGEVEVSLEDGTEAALEARLRWFD